jgi:uncharacterized protein (UPF0332 family)
MNEEVAALLAKSERSFEAAALLLAHGDRDFAASRAYYGCFYVAESLLLSHGVRLAKHGKVIAQYGLMFAKGAELDPAFYQLLLEAARYRQVGDYEAAGEISAGDVGRLIVDGRRFLAAAREWLAVRARA